MELRNRFRGALLGLACGDAVGTAVEFEARHSFAAITDMVGGGPFCLRPGEWTDDTSMALCLATSLIDTRGFEPSDQMHRYVRWWRNGYLSSTGKCFDIGITTRHALSRFELLGEPFCGPREATSAGNGCIMRLAPIPMFFYRDRHQAIYLSGESARTTHGAPECIEASRLFGAQIQSALSGNSKETILYQHGVNSFQSEAIRQLANGVYRTRNINDIRGSGYVVESLEAALWCFLHTDNFRDAILCATNLGDDADTTAAICGQLAGAYYGDHDIPNSWLHKLAMRNEIADLADQLHALATSSDET